MVSPSEHAQALPVKRSKLPPAALALFLTDVLEGVAGAAGSATLTSFALFGVSGAAGAAGVPRDPPPAAA